MSVVKTNLHKVTVTLGKATHVTAHGERGSLTLCGRLWWFECDHGTDHYCAPCQSALNRLLSPNKQSERAAIDLHKQAREKDFKLSSERIKELGTNCFACTNKLNRKYVIRLKAGTLFGIYCSTKCARSELWGPALREAKVVRITKKNVINDEPAKK